MSKSVNIWVIRTFGATPEISGNVMCFEEFADFNFNSLKHTFLKGLNGEFWQLLDRNELETFLGEASKILGVDDITARDYEFKTKVFKQFLADAYLPKPETDGETVLINLRNGTLRLAEKK